MKRSAPCRDRSRPWRVVRIAVAAGIVAGVAACGKKAPPRPPEPRGPFPPKQVEARQTGPAVIVAFEVPQPRGESNAQQPTRAELVRVAFGPGIEAPADPDAFRRRGNVVAVREGDPLDPGSRLSLSDPTREELPDGGVGWTLRYAVRVRDRRGRPSPLVVSLDLVPVRKPGRPEGLSAEATADGIRLKWSTPPGEVGARYNVYRSPEGEPFGERPLHDQPLDSPEYLDTTAEIGSTYRYEARTVVGEPPPFRESAGSNVVTLLAEDRFAPAAPVGLVAVQEGPGVRLFWDPSPEKDVAGYRVYRRVESSSWERIGPNPVPEPLFLDDSVGARQRLTYRVTAVDRANPPNESTPSDTVELVIAREAPEDRGEARP